MGEQIKYMVSKLQESFEGSPWYGDSMMEKLNKIDYKIGNNHTSTFTNSVAKLVQHILNWKIFTINKILGDKKYDIELNSSDDWKDINIQTELDWIALIDKLRETQRELENVLSIQEDSLLDNTVPGKTYNFRFLIEGIIQHDIYHLGQIALVAKLKSEK